MGLGPVVLGPALRTALRPPRPTRTGWAPVTVKGRHPRSYGCVACDRRHGRCRAHPGISGQLRVRRAVGYLRVAVT
jgi:hypothetical protein